MCTNIDSSLIFRYFNTVGSKEGFVPKTFVSSRANRASNKDGATAAEHTPQQRAEDFMDEEDLADLAETQKLTTQDAFAGIGGGSASATSRKDGDGSLFAEVFGSGQESAGETKGYQLLRRMKWKPGQGIGPMVRRRADGDRSGATHLFAPRDVPLIKFTRKTDRHGVGYGDSGSIKLMPILQSKPRPMKKKLFGVPSGPAVGSDDEDDAGDVEEMGPRITIKKKPKKKKKVAGIAGIVAEGITKSASSGIATARPQLCHDGRPPLKGFVLAVRSRVLPETNKYPPPTVPPGWKSALTPRSANVGSANPAPASGAKPSTYQTTSEAARASTLDPRSRAALLGEQLLPGKSVFDFLTPEARERIVAATGNTALPAGKGEALPGETPAPGGDTSLPANPADRLRTLWSLVPHLDPETAAGALARGRAGWMPYAEEPEKRERYRAFLELSAAKSGSEEGRTVASQVLPPRPATFSLKEWSAELREFAAAAEVFKPTTGLLGLRFTSSTTNHTSSPANADGSAGSTNAKPEPPTDPAEAAAKMNMHGPLTRKRTMFHPPRLLCKRFGVPAPPTASGTSADPDAEGRGGGGGGGGMVDEENSIPKGKELVNAASLARMMAEANMRSREARTTAAAGVGGDEGRNPEFDDIAEGEVVESVPGKAPVDPEKNEALEGARPDASLFRSIFGGEDSSDDDDA